MIRRTRTAIIAGSLALTAAGMFALTGCHSDPAAAPTTPSGQATTSAPATSNAPTPTPSATSKSPEDVATASAKAALYDYFRVLDTSLQAPSKFDTGQFKKVAISSALLDAQNRFNSIVAQNYHQIGDTKLVEVTATKVDLTNKPKTHDIPIVEFKVCYDVSGLNVVDAKGKSVVSTDRKTTGVVSVGVANYKYPTGPWQVAYTEYKPGEPC